MKKGRKEGKKEWKEGKGKNARKEWRERRNARD
jgi:hypothetical protein